MARKSTSKKSKSDTEAVKPWASLLHIDGAERTDDGRPIESTRGFSPRSDSLSAARGVSAESPLIQEEGGNRAFHLNRAIYTLHTLGSPITTRAIAEYCPGIRAISPHVSRLSRPDVGILAKRPDGKGYGLTQRGVVVAKKDGWDIPAKGAVKTPKAPVSGWTMGFNWGKKAAQPEAVEVSEEAGE